MQKIIIDTDIGDDIDDALAITFALNSPEVDVVGITTVYRDTVKRAKIAKKLLKLGKISRSVMGSASRLRRSRLEIVLPVSIRRM